MNVDEIVRTHTHTLMMMMSADWACVSFLVREAMPHPTYTYMRYTR
jgi:hypothetical protein